MPSTNRSLDAAFQPMNAALTPALVTSVGATSVLMFTDLASHFTQRRVHIANTHATQDLALFLVPLGQAAGAETVTTSGGLVVLARSTGSFLIQANMRILVVGSGAATTFNAASSDM